MEQSKIIDTLQAYHTFIANIEFLITWQKNPHQNGFPHDYLSVSKSIARNAYFVHNKLPTNTIISNQIKLKVVGVGFIMSLNV